jgi:hypothetical protein
MWLLLLLSSLELDNTSTSAYQSLDFLFANWSRLSREAGLFDDRLVDEAVQYALRFVCVL